jgi:hypothetical protein
MAVGIRQLLQARRHKIMDMRRWARFNPAPTVTPANFGILKRQRFSRQRRAEGADLIVGAQFTTRSRQ